MSTCINAYPMCLEDVASVDRLIVSVPSTSKNLAIHSSQWFDLLDLTAIKRYETTHFEKYQSPFQERLIKKLAGSHVWMWHPCFYGCNPCELIFSS